MTRYETCPDCGCALLTEDYARRFGKCWTCYEREQFTLGQRINKALR
jgi:hypothetical protein